MSESNETVDSTLSLNQDETFVLLFSRYYSQIHGLIALVVCFTGIPLNLFNTFILIRNETAAFTTNLILICIAFFDSLIMLIYVPFCIHFYIRNKFSHSIDPYPERDTLFWIIYSLLNTCTSITFHSISIWLTVYLAFYRYISLAKSVASISKTETSKLKIKICDYLLLKNKILILFIILVCVAFCFPIYLFPTVRSFVHNNMTSNETKIVYFVDQSELNVATNDLIFKLSFYSQAIFVKLIPCILLLVFISLLINDLYVIKKNRIEKFVSFKKVYF